MQSGFRDRQPLVCDASSSGSGRIAQNGNPAATQQASNRSFHLGLREHRYGSLIVGNRIKYAAISDYSYTNAINLGIQQIGTVVGGVHPPAVHIGGCRTNRHALCNEAEVRSGPPDSLRNSWLASILMLDGFFGSHAQTVLTGSLGDRRVPLQRTCPSFGTCLVNQLYNLPSLWRNHGWISVRQTSLCQKRRGNQRQASY